MKISINDTELSVFVFDDENGLELDIPADVVQRFEDAWSLFRDSQAEVKAMYVSAMMRRFNLSLEVDGNAVREVVGGEQDW